MTTYIFGTMELKVLFHLNCESSKYIAKLFSLSIFLGGGGGGFITCDPAIYTMDHPDLTVSNFMGNSIGPKGVKGLCWSIL